MTEDYLKYWGLSKAPFSLTPDPEMLYLSNQHSECLMRLKYAIFSHKGGALLVSDNAGNGKTTLLARLKKDLNDYYSGRVKVVFIDHPTLSPIEMIGEIGNQLGTEFQTTEKIRALNSLRDRLYTFYNENIKVIVIVDEGQMLRERTDILDELRILLNFCVSDAFLLTFIFSGQKPLDSILRAMPEFWQRLPVRYFLKNLDYNDTKALVQFRVTKVGGADDIFKDDAFDGIYNYSKGCPRIICSVADLCLIIGFSKGVKHIGFVEVSTACRDMESSGDGFHYFAFLKSQQHNIQAETDKRENFVVDYQTVINPEIPAKAEIEKKEKPAPVIAPADSIACQKCAEYNNKSLVFCAFCGSPLYKKCPKCSELVETFTGECPECGVDIEVEKHNMALEFKSRMKKYDILEGAYAVWLNANGINLEEGESVLAVFPRGGFMTPSPEILCVTTAKSVSKPGDVVISDRRLIICIDETPVIMRLDRIDSCFLAETSSFLSKDSVLNLTFDNEMYRIKLPYRGNKVIIGDIAKYIQSVMLK